MKNSNYNKSIHEPECIAIIDNRTVFRKGLRASVLEIFPQASILEAGSIKDLLSQSSGITPNILLFSGSILSENLNTEIPALLKNNFRLSKTIIYCGRNAIMSLSPFYNEGVYGYIPDDFEESELSQCLSMVSHGKKYISPELVWEYFGNTSLQSSTLTKKLSRSEGLVANFLIEGKSVSWIAKSMDRNISTISTQKANIFRKMRVNNIIELARLYKQS